MIDGGNTPRLGHVDRVYRALSSSATSNFLIAAMGEQSGTIFNCIRA